MSHSDALYGDDGTEKSSITIDVLANIGREGCYHLLAEFCPFLIELLQCFTDHMDIVED